jgi:hypothetical protein
MKYAIYVVALIAGLAAVVWYVLFRDVQVVVDDALPSTLLDSGSNSDAVKSTSMATALESVVSVALPIIDTDSYPASGHVRIIEAADDTIIRYEDFRTVSGPRVHLYLANDLEAFDFVDLGPVRGTSGNINYTVPNDIDISEYRYVMYWCVTFNELFNYAELPNQ